MRPCGGRVPGFTLLIWMSVARLVCGYGLSEETKTVLLREAEFDVIYEDTVTSNNQTVYAFNYTLFRKMTEGLRVSVNVLSNVSHSPIQFVLRQRHSVMSFPVPLIIRGLTHEYSHVERTLCPPPTVNDSEEQSLFVDVWSLRSHSTQYQLRVSRVDNFTLENRSKCHKRHIVIIHVFQFFKYVFPDGVDRVIVKVISQMKFPCSVLSIQDIKCPVYDLDNNVDFTGMFQTITKLGAITVQRKDFPGNSFYVVVVVKSEDTVCGDSTDSSTMDTDRTKVLEVVVSPSPQSKARFKGAALDFLFKLQLYIFFFFFFFPGKSPASTHEYGRCGKKLTRSFICYFFIDAFMWLLSSTDLFRLSLYDLAPKDPEVLSKASLTYLWNIATIAVFYALPVLQLVITYQTFANVTGKQDICYYNFLCAYPLLGLSSFNNILSNLGYGLLGFLFLCIVFKRAITHRQALVCKDRNALVRKHLNFHIYYQLTRSIVSYIDTLQLVSSTWGVDV
uniref:SID1 transmembrane family, member 2 n=1 Tax=Periophthalmus magnuspinnatus TaxID=409849 RepID=A0A3B4A5G9_9GOBI